MNKRFTGLRTRQGQRAFSLLEMLLVGSMLTFIVFGLFVMFDQTQKALRANTAQTDVLEAARAALELVSREIEQCAVSDQPGTINLFSALHTNSQFPGAQLQTLIADTMPSPSRTNFQQNLFFLTRPTQSTTTTMDTNLWTIVGYFVMVRTNQGDVSGGQISYPVELGEDGIGTLYRFSTNVPFFPTATNQGGMYFPDVGAILPGLGGLLPAFRPVSPSPVPCVLTNLTRIYANNISPIADGIVHFRIVAYDRAEARGGEPMVYWRTNYGDFAYANRIWRSASTNRVIPMLELLTLTDHAPYSVFLQDDFPDKRRFAANQTRFAFRNGALPAGVDLELGILEPQAWEKLKALPTAAAKLQYLNKHSGQVHLFRKRIPLRSAQP